MLERFVEKTNFTSQEDFVNNLKIKAPENFNFGYDVVDAWAKENPNKREKTKNKLLKEDVIVEQIPYYETTNDAGGYTVIIG